MEKTKEGYGVATAELPKGVQAIVTKDAVILSVGGQREQERNRLLQLVRESDRWLAEEAAKFLEATPNSEFCLLAACGDNKTETRTYCGRVLFESLVVPTFDRWCGPQEVSAALLEDGELLFWEPCQEVGEGAVYVGDPVSPDLSLEAAVNGATEVHPFAWASAMRLLGRPLR